MTIQDTILSHLPSKRKPSSKGWRTFNAVCCPHNGESQDKRGRGGVITSPDGGVSYHCFNCNFKAGYYPGHQLSYKFRKLLKWLGVDDTEIMQLSVEAMREAQRQELLGLVKPDVKKEELRVEFKKIPLPDEALSFFAWVEFYELKNSTHYPEGLSKAVTYVNCRSINMQKYDFYYTSAVTEHKMDKRVIIPFTWKNEIIGYTARGMNDAILPKYYNQYDEGYVFNVDKQERDWKFVIVCEGVFDALSIDAVAVLKADVTQQQINIIEDLDREIIVVPDWNKSGQNLIRIAQENGWSVSFPVWAETCEDINAAVVKYGKLFTIKSILDSVESNPLKIKLRQRLY